MERLKLVLWSIFSEKDCESAPHNPALMVFRIMFTIFLYSSVLPEYSLGLFNPFLIKPEYAETYSQQQHSYHKGRLGIEIHIYPSADMHENKR
jgi:hypothetical protein